MILVLAVATFLAMTTAAFSQKSALSSTAGDTSQMDEQQIRQLEAELLKGEMNSDPVVFEKVLADDCVHLPAGPDFTKAKLVEEVRKSQGQVPAYIARVEELHVYILGDTAIAMFEKEYSPRTNPGQLDRQAVTDVFVRNADNWKLKISRGSPLR